MSDKIDQLEYTVMELGTEVFRLKSRISEIFESQEHVIRTLNHLRQLMDEKGVITSEDLELAEVNQSIDPEESLDLFNPSHNSIKNELH